MINELPGCLQHKAVKRLVSSAPLDAEALTTPDLRPLW